MSHYTTIARAIDYMAVHEGEYPDLATIARHIGFSPDHLEKVFMGWCGVSPKQFSRYLTLGYAKGLLAREKGSPLTSSISTGLSGTGRLHDLFVDIEAMTPGEYKNAGKDLLIHYSYGVSPFGEYLVASTDRGICTILFGEDKKSLMLDLERRWIYTTLEEGEMPIHEEVKAFLNGHTPDKKIRLHLHGTDFQLKVWKALLSIPEGSITSYGEIARTIEGGNLARAVGKAIGDNPIAYIIPCHRVIQSTGTISGYRWGVDRKRMMLGWEASKGEGDKI